MNKNDKNFLAQKIRSQYVEKEFTEFDALKKLDKKVKKPANVFAYIFGSLSALIMGSGMSLVMTDVGNTLGISETMPIGITVGVIGVIMAIINYPIYKKMLSSRRRKYAGEIIALGDALMQE